MVHKKYIKIGNKKYGPYYYESYRDGKKIKKRYVKVPKEMRRVNVFVSKGMIFAYIILIGILLSLSLLSYFDIGIFRTVPSELLLAPDGPSVYLNGGLEIRIWDDTDDGFDRFSENALNDPRYPYNFNFYSEFKDSGGNPIGDSAGSCGIQYDTGSGYPLIYTPMSYDSINQRWFISMTFNKYGTYQFEVKCSSGTDVQGTNFFTVSNTPPIFTVVGKTFNGFEDEVVTHDYSAEVYDPDVNSIVVYSHSKIIGPAGEELNGDGSLYSWITIDSDTGMSSISATNDGQTGTFDISARVIDETGDGESRTNRFIISAVNDVPVFVNLENKSFNMSELFEYVIIADDEEKNFPLTFSIEFLSCDTAEWSSRQDTNCVLFDNTQYSVNDTVISISFTPTKDDVGSYIIKISAQDSLGAIRSEVVNFSVLNINSPPSFEEICNQRSTVEDSDFSCTISALDGDEVNELNFSSNESWFLDLKSVSVNSLTNFRGSVLASFKPSDENVGNWLINISVVDSGNPMGIASEVIPFFVDNVADAVFLEPIEDVIAYTSNLYSIVINATDDDLLIPDKSVYDEVLTFDPNPPAQNWITVRNLGVVLGTNIVKGAIEFDPRGHVGVHDVTITVRDKLGSTASRTFRLTIVQNDPPVWDVNTPRTHVINEDDAFSLDLAPFVSDPDNEAITFSFVSDKAFPEFSLDANTGLISLVPSDADVGQHILTINASDGKIATPLEFNFTVYNVPDTPSIVRPLVEGSNITIDPLTSNMNTSEDASVSIFMFIQDDDFAIPNNQRDFYSESLNIDFLTIEGLNTNLFGFNGPLPTASVNKLLFSADFTPRKADVGYYNITVNVSDASRESDLIEFNLSITPVEHAPVIHNLANLSSAINREFYFDINSTDVEDGVDEGGNLTYRYEFLVGNNFLDEATFNNTAGIINITFDETDVGRYLIRIYVKDSFGLESVGEFWLYVYGMPQIDKPDLGFVFNLSEGNESILNFSASDFILENLTYEIYVHNLLREKRSDFSGKEFLARFTPGYEDETYGLFGELTLVVYPLDYSELNTSKTWNVNITHANAPMIFAGSIGERQGVVGQPILINLSSYFYDADAFDVYYNQSVNFNIVSYNSVSGISSKVADWSLSLSASQPLEDIFNITGSDLEGSTVLTNATSNPFKISFVQPPVVTVPTPTTSNTEIEKPVLLKLVLPGPISIKKGESITVPIQLVNEANVVLRGIKLTSLFAFGETVLDNIKVNFSRDFIGEIASQRSENVSLTIEAGQLQKGAYEIHINATVASPRYRDWGKIYVNVEEGESIVEKLVFIEELIAENPECAEIKELVDESKRYADSGDLIKAEIKIDEAINACKLTISQQSYFSRGKFRSKLQDRVFIYLAITTILAIVFGITYYVYRKTIIRRAFFKAQQPESANRDFMESFNNPSY